ncbi:ABC transporter ATP-binding protein [Clostridium sp.]|uniref:ABC transporter ATP-binding protein n=1 Tax=Clostridium sp. TaxID=1506 RepID=UPI00359FF547
MSQLVVTNLEKSFEGGKKIINNISFKIDKGESVGFLGPNGAGKTTTIRTISNLLEIDNGDILFNDTSIKKNSLNLKSKLGVVPQDIAVFEDLSAYENVKFFCSLYGFRGKALNEKVKSALNAVGLLERAGDIPSKFSGGMKRRLNIACSIAHEPEILIMDEPTVGIDPQSRNNILTTVRKLNEKGTTIIYVSHYMEEVEVLCKRIILLDHGRIIKDTTLSKLLSKNIPLSLEEIFLKMTGTKLRDAEE